MRKNENVGWLVERARFCIRERAFVEKWLEINQADWRGVPLVQRIFCRSEERKPPRILLSAREKFIIATVIQWLGTNVGFGFLSDVLEKIGYKLTPVNVNRKREYYNPFVPLRDASAWHNLNAEQKEKIPPKLVIRPKKRKHIFRYLPNIHGKKACIRCGIVISAYGSYSEKGCVPPLLPVKVTKIKKLEGRILTRYV